jgi:hypothetical protein|tara:strand:- start:329 stop:904 length:576 start_codon:yes stop_codon:yes gene_type:complete
MKKIIFYLLLFNLFFNITGNANESNPYKQNFEEIFNIGKMLSHNKKFTLFFRSRDKAILARGAEYNYITDYPQDLYILNNDNGKTSPVITYDWFPQKAKSLSLINNLPIFPEDYAYYLLNDNETLIMISGVKFIRSNFKFNLKHKKLEKLANNSKYKLFVSSLLKDCGYKDINATYKCSYYKPLISVNLID